MVAMELMMCMYIYIYMLQSPIFHVYVYIYIYICCRPPYSMCPLQDVPYMCCPVEKVGVELQDEALAMAHNAVRATFLQDVQKNLRRGSRKAAGPVEPEEVLFVLRVAVPADGRCCCNKHFDCT